MLALAAAFGAQAEKADRTSADEHRGRLDALRRPSGRPARLHRPRVSLHARSSSAAPASTCCWPDFRCQYGVVTAAPGRAYYKQKRDGTDEGSRAVEVVEYDGRADNVEAHPLLKMRRLIGATVNDETTGPLIVADQSNDTFTVNGTASARRQRVDWPARQPCVRADPRPRRRRCCGRWAQRGPAPAPAATPAGKGLAAQHHAGQPGIAPVIEAVIPGADKGWPACRLEARGLQKTWRSRKVVHDHLAWTWKGGGTGCSVPANARARPLHRLRSWASVRADAGEITIDGEPTPTCPSTAARAWACFTCCCRKPSIFRSLGTRRTCAPCWSCRPRPTSAAAQVAGCCTDRGAAADRTAVRPARGPPARFRRRSLFRAARAPPSRSHARWATQPRFILLDEPFKGIDPIAVIEIQCWIISFLKERGIGVLITDHNVRGDAGYLFTPSSSATGHVLAQGTPSEIAGQRRGDACTSASEHFRMTGVGMPRTPASTGPAHR